MAFAPRAGVLAGLILLAAPAIATPLSTLQQNAAQCFSNPASASCNAVWDLSHQLKQRAGNAYQLRCYTSLLALEAMVAMAKLGYRDPAEQAQSLDTTSRECR
ncbi:MAG: hypothetical protein VKK62_10445 [Synechococcaceae cyanobacterium]|nr:hypothetical protein [Synechococcaceae cyanobacterium]